MSRAYYNEIDPYAAQWLRNLIDAGHIAPGDVDERSIVDVQPSDLAGYTQCHFFAGIGGWSLALRLAGWPDDKPAWTGSCPCQPFSVAGKALAFADERHLWPVWFELVRACRPVVVFGEQVASRVALDWLDHVCLDLEGQAYAVGAADLCAASVGAPHIRQRLWWVAHHYGLADNDDDRCQEQRRSRLLDGQRPAQWHDADGRGVDGSVADLPEQGRREQPQRDAGAHGRPAAESGRLRDADPVGHASVARPQGSEQPWERVNPQREAAERAGATGPVGHASSARSPEQRRGWNEPARLAAPGVLDPWADLEWIECSDGKARPTQPGLFPLAHGIPNRVGRLRAYGNAIVPQVAATFIQQACLNRR